MKYILYIAIFIFIPIASISSQENKSRFGVEIGVRPWAHNPSLKGKPFTISGFAGGSYEHFFTNTIALKSTIGLHNVAYRKSLTGKEMGSHSNLGLTVEPRFYFWANQQKWGNLFAGLPVSAETPLFPKKDPYKEPIYNKLVIRATAVAGYQYYFTRHAFAELNAGLGWYQDRYTVEKAYEFAYLIEARFGFSF